MPWVSEAYPQTKTGQFIDKQAIEHFDSDHSRDWSGIIDPLTDAGQLSAFINPRLSYFNVGTPEEFYEAERFLEQQS